MGKLQSPYNLQLRVFFPEFSFTLHTGTPILLRLSHSSESPHRGTTKLLVIEKVRCSSQTNMSVMVCETWNRPKSPIPASDCGSDDRNMSVLCPLGPNWVISCNSEADLSQNGPDAGVGATNGCRNWNLRVIWRYRMYLRTIRSHGTPILPHY